MRSKTLEILLWIGLVPAYAIALLAPAVGHNHDDGIYVVTAKALAEGHGYRIISSPDEPVQTKYPPLYPALLACIWHFFPSFPANTVALKLASLSASLLWFILIRKLLSEGLPDLWAGRWLVPLVAASPLVVFLSTTVLSDTLFAALSTACLLSLRKAESKDGLTPAIIAAVLASLAFNTRTAGIAVIAAGIVALAAKRRYRSIVAFTVICLALCLPWVLWQSANSEVAASNSYNSWDNYYRSWNVLFGFTAGQKAAIVEGNLMYFVLAPCSAFGAPNTVPAVIVCVTIAFLIATGFIADIRRGGVNVIQIYVVLYHGMLLMWACPPFRFLSAILPFMLVFAFRGIEAVLGRAARLGQAIVWCGLSAMLAFSLVSQSKVALELGMITAPGAGGQRLVWSEFILAMHRIHDGTDEHARLIGILDPAFYLYAGRKADSGFQVDPVEVYEGSHDISIDRVQALADLIATKGITHLVELPPSARAEAYLNRLLAAFKLRCPGAAGDAVVIAPGYRISPIHPACGETR